MQEQAAPAPGKAAAAMPSIPSQNPNAPGAPRALGRRTDADAGGTVGAPGGREAGEPLDLANTSPAVRGRRPAARLRRRPVTAAG